MTLISAIYYPFMYHTSFYLSLVKLSFGNKVHDTRIGWLSRDLMSLGFVRPLAVISLQISENTQSRI
jgi:hypothetical protein